MKADVLGDALETYRNIDADEFKAALLAAADRDGSFEGWLKPEAVRDLETQGEKFFPSSWRVWCTRSRRICRRLFERVR